MTTPRAALAIAYCRSHHLTLRHRKLLDPTRSLEPFPRYIFFRNGRQYHFQLRRLSRHELRAVGRQRMPRRTRFHAVV